MYVYLVGLLDADGNILQHKMESLCSLDADETVKQIADMVYGVITEYGITTVDSIAAIGLALPGLLDLDLGLAVAISNFPSWKNYPLIENFKKHINIPVSDISSTL